MLEALPWFYGLMIPDVRRRSWSENPSALVSAEHDLDRVTAKPSYSGQSIRACEDSFWLEA
jgi:hypothetical protein